jgi:hypothetical protein
MCSGCFRDDGYENDDDFDASGMEECRFAQEESLRGNLPIEEFFEVLVSGERIVEVHWLGERPQSLRGFAAGPAENDDRNSERKQSSGVSARNYRTCVAQRISSAKWIAWFGLLAVSGAAAAAVWLIFN